MNSISLQFSLAWQEYFFAERFMLRQQNWLLPEQVSGGVLLLSNFFFLLLPTTRWLIFIALPAGLLLLSVPIFRRLGLKKRWQREPMLRAQHFVKFSPERIHYNLYETESNLDWNYYQSWLEAPQGFLLIYGQNVFNFIPKSAFTNLNAMDNFRTLLAAKLPQY